MVRHPVTGLILVLVLVCALIPKPALASDSKPIRSQATGAFGPIGSIYSLGAMSINGRPAHGEQAIWAGDLVSAPESNASADLTGVGRVGFSKGSSARLLTSIGGDLPKRQGVVLTVVVEAGSFAVSLQSDSAACVEIGESVITSSSGAKFRIGMIGGEAFVEVERGELINLQSQPRVKYLVKSVKLDLQGKPVAAGPNTYRERTSNSVEIPVSVEEVKPQPIRSPPPQSGGRVLRVAYQGAPALQAVAGIEIEFCLTTNKTIGSFVPAGGPCTTERTDQYGVAKAQFRAGDQKGTSKIRATVVVSREDYWEGTIEVYKLGFWRLRNILIMAAAAGAATFCILKCGPSRGPLRQEPPPVIP